MCLVALAYAAAGRLGLFLAIPPGYASPVWPAAGIALAAALLYGNRIWPGILAGSFLVNVATSFDASTPSAFLLSSWIPLGIGIGAALQALAGAASCVVNATCGVATLWTAGAIPSRLFPFSWWTWWVGDAIGVLIFTPILVLWAASPGEVSRARKISVTWPLVLVFLIALAAFHYARHWEDRGIKAELDRRVGVIQTEWEGIARAPGRGTGALEAVRSGMASEGLEIRLFEEGAVDPGPIQDWGLGIGANSLLRSGRTPMAPAYRAESRVPRRPPGMAELVGPRGRPLLHRPHRRLPPRLDGADGGHRAPRRGS